LGFADDLQLSVNPQGGYSQVKLISTLLFVIAFVLAPLAVAEPLVDINTADIEALEAVKGLGPTKAQAILDYRTKYGSFKSVDDLANVPGIKDKTVEQLRPYLTVGSDAAMAPPAPSPGSGDGVH
jgi:competence protein ComEA